MKNNKGFSLVELIVVIAIMAILAAVAIPTFAHFINKANLASDKDYAAGIEYAVNLALASEAQAATEIAVTWDEETGKITKLTYKNGDKTGTGATATDVIYVAIGDAETGEVAVTNTEIKTAIVDIIDADYDVKTAGPITSESGVVTVTVVPKSN